MSKVMLSLPDKLVTRMKAVIPAGERSQTFAKLLEKEIEKREMQLYQLACELESNKELTDEMKAWDEQFGSDGLEDL